MIIDPAGNGGDEVAYGIGGASNSYIHIFSVGGFKGGMSEENMVKLINLAVEMEVTDIKVEANMGHGVVSSLLIGQAEKMGVKGLGFEDFYAKGQKEKRIIDTISPVTRRHKLIVHRRALEDDWTHCQQHARDKRTVTSFMYQLVNITYDRGALTHDDRIDTVQGLVQFLSAVLVVDDEKEAHRRTLEAAKEFTLNPMGYTKAPTKGRFNTNRIKRRA
jgi:hypothetical protein